MPRESRIRHFPLAFFYAIVSDEACKIGVTVNPPARLQTCRVHNPRPVRIGRLWIATRKAAFRIENELTAQLAHAHIHGEWYYTAAAGVAAALDLVDPSLRRYTELVDKEHTDDPLVLHNLYYQKLAEWAPTYTGSIPVIHKETLP